MQLEIFWGEIVRPAAFCEAETIPRRKLFLYPCGLSEDKARLIVKSTILTILEHREEKDRENHT